MDDETKERIEARDPADWPLDQVDEIIATANADQGGEPLDADDEDVQPPTKLVYLSEVLQWRKAAEADAKASTKKKGADAE